MGVPRAVILAGAAHRAAAIAWAAALEAVGAVDPLILIERRSLGVRLGIVRRRLARHGMPTVLGQLLYLAWIATDRVRRVSGAMQDGASPATPSPVPEIHTLADVNDAATAARIRAARPTLAAVYGTSVIRGETLAALPAESFNLHTGLIRHHRGVACTFWALAAGHPDRIGVTVHRLTAGIDTGTPVAERVLGLEALAQAVSMRGLEATVARSGEALMRDVLVRVARGELPRVAVTHDLGPLHRAPTLREYRRVIRRFGLR
jgi:folate-dependent phosphoribosylglycinamide formyltransferase PurN